MPAPNASIEKASEHQLPLPDSANGSSSGSSPDSPQNLINSRRVEYKDQAVRQHISGGDWSNRQFLRLVAIRKRITNVNFNNSTFDACYLRDSEFDSCNFTGVRFSATNLHGAKFTGCIFDYAIFDRTIIDDEVLADNCPSNENQKARFARNLRINYQKLGDASAANRAIRIELSATETHLQKSWKSNDYYYRKKYSGPIRRTK